MKPEVTKGLGSRQSALAENVTQANASVATTAATERFGKFVMTHIANGKAVLWGLPVARQAEVSLALWGIGSTRALRVHWMLAELGLPYISHRIQSGTDETLTPAYLKINPRHKIPTLRHGPLLMTDSAAIVQYLSERFETPVGFFAPTDPAQRAKVYEWCYFAMNELDGHTLYVIRRHICDPAPRRTEPYLWRGSPGCGIGQILFPPTDRGLGAKLQADGGLSFRGGV